MEKILAIFLVSIFLLSFVIIGPIISNNEHARENAKAPEKSPIITEIEDGELEGYWALPAKDVGKPCKNSCI